MARTAEELQPSDIEARLRALYDDLDQFPPGVSCAWPLSRVFNELLKQVKRERPSDPVVASIAFLRDRTGDGEVAGSSQPLVGTVRVLAGQLLASLSAAGGSSPRARSSSRGAKSGQRTAASR